MEWRLYGTIPSVGTAWYIDVSWEPERRLLRLTMQYLTRLGPSACLALAALSSSARPGDHVRVIVDLAKPLAAMPSEGLGLGVAVWDDHMMDAAVPALVRQAGFSVIRYPGGSYADIYHWKTHSASKIYPEATIRPGDDFDSFMRLVRGTRTTPLITVNYGTNPAGTSGADPDEAADWVRYANKLKGYRVRYWEIGNEIYGNGFYNGRGWEADLHAPDSQKPADRLKNPELGPTVYGRNVAEFSRKMKAVDPTIKVGAVLCCPYNWPDRLSPDWNSNVLKECGSQIDFAVVHWYGNGESVAKLLDGPKSIPPMVARLRQDLEANAGPRASSIKIWVSEGDASGYNTRPQGALFAADQFATWIESGASNMCWWDLHNGLGGPPGREDDQGMLSNASKVRNVSEPPANTPFPAYFGIQAFHRLAPAGSRFVTVETGDPQLRAHATKDRDGHLRILLINDDQAHPKTISLTLKGGSRYGLAKRFDYRPGGKTLIQSKLDKQPNGLAVTLAADSLTVLDWQVAR